MRGEEGENGEIKEDVSRKGRLCHLIIFYLIVFYFILFRFISLVWFLETEYYCSAAQPDLRLVAILLPQLSWW